MEGAGGAGLLAGTLTNLVEYAAEFGGNCADARIEEGQAGREEAVVYSVCEGGAELDIACAAIVFGAHSKGLAAEYGRQGGPTWERASLL